MQKLQSHNHKVLRLFQQCLQIQMRQLWTGKIRKRSQVLGTIQRSLRLMSRIKRFNDYRHIKIEIKLPVGNSTDLITEDDMKVAKELLIKEWIQQREEIDKWFGLIVVEPKRPKLPK